MFVAAALVPHRDAAVVVASAAAALRIDIHELREAKRQGCLAFRSGRVYRDEFLSWREARELERVGSVGADGFIEDTSAVVVAVWLTT